MDWDDVRHFLALARLGSVRAAGASLGVSHSTVARRVEALEERLSARLFDRNRDGYCLTEAGKHMLPGAERVEREMAEANGRVESMDAERRQRQSPEDLETEALSLYERLLEVREGVALAELDGRICQMCYIQVPPNLSVRVLRGTEVVQCPSCDRILYQRD